MTSLGLESADAKDIKDIEEGEKKVEEFKRQRLKAMLFISIYSAGSVGASTCFKLLAKKGVTVADFCLMRAIVQFVCSSAVMFQQSINVR